MRLYCICLAVLLSGCSESTDDLRAQLDHQNDKIANIERDLANERQDRLALKFTTPRASDPAAEQMERTVAQLANSAERMERTIADLNARIAALESARPQEPAPVEPPLGKILPSKPTPVSIYTAPDNRFADFIETPAGGSADLFPIRITEAAGRKTVVGTHMTTSIVESPTLSKDDYGRKVPERIEVQEPVNEYVSEVVFTAQNLTRTEKTISFTAGAGTQTRELKPGESAPGIVLRSAIGADLHVECAGMVRNFPITY